MFETRTDAWEKVGLAANVSPRAVKRAQREIAVLVPLLIAVLVGYSQRHHIFGHKAEIPVRIATVIVLAVLGWAIARAAGRAAAPTFFRRMDPSTAGTVGFIIRLATMAITLLAALRIAQVSPSTLLAGSAFTAVIIGLAAQQTLGNLFAGMVLLSARPFRVGERVRLQAGGVGGSIEGIVSSLGLLYTTLARGEDRVLIPNSVVLAAAVVPIREPDPVDVKVRLRTGISMTQIQAILDDQVTTATRSPASVLLEEIDGDDVVVRVQATPERASEGAHLADEIIGALATVTGEHATVGGDSLDHR
ncbi:MAG TPA: mechanosensitive ion channel family protein [Solirubrobacteraceae bacterium]|nr:mechanosensitive ion channel family protein [Solirubrobacteraceae bacterium]